jgi:aryl-alcohol dehydrogenase
LAGVMAAKATGVQTIIAVDAMQSRLEAAQNLGASHVIHAVAGLDLVAQIKRICGTGATHSLDTTANMTVLRQAIDCLAPRGVCGFLGGAAVGSELIVNVRDVMIGGKTIRGIVEGDSQPAELIPRLIAMYRAGQFPMDKIARFYPFADIAKAITDSESGAAIKAILRMPD